MYKISYSIGFWASLILATMWKDSTWIFSTLLVVAFFYWIASITTRG